MVESANLGFPRIGAKRELKKATEAYWKSNSTLDELLAMGRDLRERHWKLQKEAGIQVIPSNDFAFYDQMLNMTATLGAVPARFGWKGGTVDVDTYFAMARGTDRSVACEMTKWFDTNYHYIAPEFVEDQQFSLSSDQAVAAFLEAKALGIETRPVLIGPLTWLHLGKVKGTEFDPLALLPRLLPVYEELLANLRAAGAAAVQIDEPILVLDLPAAWREAFKSTYARITGAKGGDQIMLATYFEGLRDNLDLALSLPTEGLHVDLVRAPDQVKDLLAKAPKEKLLSLGLIDGRNVWRADLRAKLQVALQAIKSHGDRIHIAPSCSLLHCPVDLEQEKKMDAEILNWLAFSRQKLVEVAALTKGTVQGEAAIASELKVSDAAHKNRSESSRIHAPAVKARVKKITVSDYERSSPFLDRQKAQQARLNLPSFPTTTIGSFPQTQEIRKARAAFKRKDITEAEYAAFLEAETRSAVTFQEDIGLDVLVHGEFERNDMVEYFGEQLDGFVFTKNGWVQSYGSRCVKPPVIFGDVSRPQAMTVRWTSYASSLTDKPMKGMLTGPVTILMWSFERDDQSREDTCRQIGLAIRDEVVDLEKADIEIVQIDEPAFREGLPLRKADWPAYLKWATECFRLSASGVRDDTQIHTHMCYSEFNDIIDSIASLDADVISIETSRSDMELLEAFVTFNYPNEIGPGVWDIHAPRAPDVEEMVHLMNKAANVVRPSALWVNPDCGLKTRDWPEVKVSLANMVATAKEMRKKIPEVA